MVIGLTGGIGSGKTTVLKMFEKLGVVTYNADVEARLLINTSLDIKCELEKVFGKEAYKDKQLNRPFIANIVFNNPEKLAALNSITHPRLHAHFKNFIKAQQCRYIVYEAAILLESEGYKLCDFIITVTATEKEKIKRIQARDGMSIKEITARMNSQMSDELRIEKSNFVIVNNNLKATQEQVLTLNGILLGLKRSK